MSHISFSELKNWQKCPYYHKLVHIDKLKGFKGNEFTAFGNALHSVCEYKCVDTPPNFNAEEHFDKVFQTILKELERDSDLDIGLIKKMRVQARKIIPHIESSLKEYFGEYEVISVEEPLMEEIEEHISKEHSFKGYIDLVLKTSDGRYHVIDWKTCSWGWNARRKADPMTTYQLAFYKHYYAYKHGLDPSNVETHFALLKRTAKKNNIEIFKVTSGKKRIENALNLLKSALYNIKKENYLKNRMSCDNCEFYKTQHCV